MIIPETEEEDNVTEKSETGTYIIEKETTARRKRPRDELDEEIDNWRLDVQATKPKAKAIPALDTRGDLAMERKIKEQRLQLQQA